MTIIADYEIAAAAGHDAGNLNMERHGRKQWNEEDFAEAQRVFRNVLGSLATMTVKGTA